MIHYIPNIGLYSTREPSFQALNAPSKSSQILQSHYESTMLSCEIPPAPKGIMKRCKEGWQRACQKMQKCMRHFSYWLQDSVHVVGYIIKQKFLCIRLPNFHKVNSRFFRGGQPTKKGFSELEKKGIRTIISLRKEKSDETLLKGKKLNYAHFSFDSSKPTLREVLDFLRIVTTPSYQPVFVHCYFGADRTGLACALYRIFVDNWPKEKALKEMKQGGYGFHHCYRHFVDFINQLDVNNIRAQLQSA